MPNFFKRRNMTGAKDRTPFFLGQSLSNKAESFCVASWNIRVSIAAANKLLAA